MLGGGGGMCAYACVPITRMGMNGVRFGLVFLLIQQVLGIHMSNVGNRIYVIIRVCLDSW